MRSPTAPRPARDFLARLLLAIALIAIVPFLVVGGIGVELVRSASQDEALAHVQADLVHLGEGLSGRLDQQAQAVAHFAQASALRQLLSQLDLPKGPSEAATKRASEDMADFLGNHPRAIRLRLVSRDGRTLLQADRGEPPPNVAASGSLAPRDDEALKVALSMGSQRLFVSPLRLRDESAETGPALLLVAAGVTDATGSPRAALMMEIPVEPLVAPAPSAGALADARLHLLDRSGRILRWGGARHESQPQLVAAIQAGDSLPRVVADQAMATDKGLLKNGDRMVVWSALSPGVPAVSNASAPVRWTLVAVLPHGVPAGSMGAVWLWHAVLSVLLVAMAGGGWMLARWTLRPLPTLAAQVTEIAGGRISRRIEPPLDEPLRSIASGVNALAERIEDLEERSSQAALDQTRRQDATTRQLVREMGELTALVDGLPFGVVMLDRDGRVERSNAPAADMLGIDQQRLHGGWMPGFVPIVESMLGHEGRRQRRVPVRGLPTDLLIAPFGGKEGGPIRYILILRTPDPDDGHGEASPFGSLGETMVRECGQIVRGMVGRSLSGLHAMARALLKEASPDDAHHRHLARLESEMSRLTERIKPLLAMGDLPPPQIGTLQVREAVDAVLAQLKIRAEAQGIELDATGVAGDLPEAAADPVRFRQMLLLLALNALDAMPTGGRLSIAADASGPTLALTITDSGEGIDESRLGRVFDPFVTSRPGHLGLGLPCVRRIVQQHGAEISVASAPGKGTRIRLGWPVASGVRMPE